MTPGAYPGAPPAGQPLRLLVTGPPGIGKTTLVRRVVERLLPGRLAGFLTEELRGPAGRTGFRVTALDGREGVLARAGSGPGPRVGRYPRGPRVLRARGSPGPGARGGVRLFVVDEIGKMELHSARFARAIEALWAGPAAILATVPLRAAGLAADLKRRPGARLVALDGANRDALVAEIAAELARCLGVPA